jgi:exonuclease SbcD
MITFVHTADIHFGVENYGYIDPTTGIHTRLLDFEKALNFCIDYAIEHKVDFFMFSGDAYKTAHPSPTQQRLLINCFLRLYKAQIPVIIVVGNHDNPVSFGKAHALDVFGQLPIDGFHVFSKPGFITLQTKNGPVQVVGIPWPSRTTLALSLPSSSAHEIAEQVSKHVCTLIDHFIKQLSPEIPTVLSGHLTVSSGVFSGSEKRAIYGSDPLFLPSDLAKAPFDYIGLGHLHRYQNLNVDGYPAVVYSGSPERVDFGERKEEKGFCLVTIHEKGTTSHEFIQIPTRPFIQVEVYLEGNEQHTEQIITELQKYDLHNAVVKIVYHVPPQVKEVVDLAKLKQICADAHHLVGIFPIKKPVVREQRAAVNVSMDLPTLLTHYSLVKQEIKPRLDAMLKKLHTLLEEIESSSNS